MRILSMTALMVVGLAIGATLVNRPATNTLALAAELQQPSIMVDQLTANTKHLPVQSFDAF